MLPEQAVDRPSNLENLVVYQTGWFAVVLGAGWGYPAWGFAAGLIGIAFHLYRVEHRAREARLLALSAGLGFVVDSFQVRTGTLIFDSGVWIPGLAPPWIALMWAQFATTFRHALRWLARKPYRLGIPLAAIGGPLAYFTGSRFGAVNIGDPAWLRWALVGMAWSIALPLLLVRTRVAQADG